MLMCEAKCMRNFVCDYSLILSVEQFKALLSSNAPHKR